MTKRSLPLVAALTLLIAAATPAPAQSVGDYLGNFRAWLGYAHIDFLETHTFNEATVPGRRTEMTISSIQLGAGWYFPIVTPDALSIGLHMGASAVSGGAAPEDPNDDWTTSDDMQSGVIAFDFPLFVGARTGRDQTLDVKTGFGGGVGLGVVPIIYVNEGTMHYAPAAMGEFIFGSRGLTAVRVIYSLEIEHVPELTSRKLSVDVQMKL